MYNLTREKLIKTIVAEEMMGCSGEDYHQKLKFLYHKWEHESGDKETRPPFEGGSFFINIFSVLSNIQ